MTPKPGPLGSTTACTGHVPHTDDDGFRWKLWCIGTNGHRGQCQTLAGRKFTKDGAQ